MAQGKYVWSLVLSLQITLTKWKVTGGTKGHPHQQYHFDNGSIGIGTFITCKNIACSTSQSNGGLRVTQTHRDSVLWNYIIPRQVGIIMHLYRPEMQW